jgi:iron complex outermembrane receptor protein
MMRVLKFIFQLWLNAGCFLPVSSFAQESTVDSTEILGEVVLRAYEQNRQLKQVATAINYIGPNQFNRFSNATILSAVNSTPGVRMEERSPGSYRLNIRGSTMRSPFGVRNVKIYFDEFPLTDPGGDTYLSQLSFYNFHSVEIIKGPGGSLYGAGTGGVMLIQSQPPEWRKGFSATVLGGSYGMFNTGLQLKAGNEKWQHVLNFSHLNSDGYRQHTSLRRDVMNYQLKIRPGKKNELRFLLLYSDIYYQTPGALTKAEYDANPKSARPASGMFPSAEDAQAAIFQKIFFGGAGYKHLFSEQLENTTVVYGNFPQIKNPTFRNYGRRYEPQWGARTVFKWKDKQHDSHLQLVWGAEIQQGYFNSKTYTNNGGSPGILQIEDKVTPSSLSIFVQTDYSFSSGWLAGFGLSSNQYTVKINRVSVPGFIPVKRKFQNQVAPKIALSKNVFQNTWIYASLSRGYSPPTVSEVLPSAHVISTGLQPEHGLSYEAGFKSSWLQQRLYAEVNVFYFELKDAIVQRRDSANADYFVNAGSTRQKGMESQLIYRSFIRENKFIRRADFRLSYTWFHFRYRDYKQINTDYSGKKIPGAAPHSLAVAADLTFKKDFYLNATWQYSGRIPLHDANTVYAGSYLLLGFRLGWMRNISAKKTLELFAGADNLLDEKYSLGNDINAAGGRYYNAAPGRNYYTGVSVMFK